MRKGQLIFSIIERLGGDIPELPEVETIRRQIDQSLPCKILKIKKGEHLASFALKNPQLAQIKEANFTQIERRGKYLIWNFAEGVSLLSHLGMSGGWRLSHSPCKEAHCHLALKCARVGEEDFYLSYVDPRRFGRLKILPTGEVEQYFKGKLGPDLLHHPMTGATLEAICQRYPNRPLKVALLDQRLFAGIGNYLACEIAAHARIHPRTPLGSINKTFQKKILKAIQDVLMGNVRHKGLTFQGGYRDTTGGTGDALDHLVVFYQKTCGLCAKTPVQKITLAGRGTYFCPSCQKL